VRRLARLIVLVALAATGTWACAHPAVRCAAILKVDAQGQATLTVRFDVPAFALNEDPFKVADEPMWAWVDGPRAEVERLLRDAAGRLSRHVQVKADGESVPIELRSFPGVADFEQWKRSARGNEEKPRLPWMAEALIGFEIGTTKRSEPARGVRATVRLPEVLGDVVLAVEAPGMEAEALVLKAGETSPEIEVGLAGSKEEHAAASPSSGFFSFVRMGAEHVVPDGLDHMLFILGLYLASPRLKSLLILVTMFTLAHSVTLTLAAIGLVAAPPRVIEPVIALSIAAVAIENILARPRAGSREGPQGLSFGQDAVRAAIVFAFGLVHGLGFASAFGEMELPRSVLVPALVGFNVGVEVGQLLVLCGAFVVIGWAARKPWYRKAVVIPGSAAIACVGLYWAVTRAI
jgi:hypothetical protein